MIPFPYTKWFSPRSVFRVVPGILMVVAMMAVYGCGHGGPKVVTVTGTVTHQGKPVSNLTLNFQPEKGRPSWGVTDDKGHYSLNYNREQEGAVTGKHTVWVRFRSRNPMEEMQGANNTLPASLKKYSSAETTPLTFEVSTGGRWTNKQRWHMGGRIAIGRIARWATVT